MDQQDSKADVPVTDLERLHEFCRRGHKSSVHEVIVKDKNLLNTKGKLGWTGLHWAAASGHADVVELLCHEGAKVNVQNDGLDTPLHLAAWKGYHEVARVLLKWKADKTIQNQDKKTPPQLARTDAMKEQLPEINDDEIADMVTLAQEESSDDEGDQASVGAITSVGGGAVGGVPARAPAPPPKAKTGPVPPPRPPPPKK